jgi:hypothetical protein
VSGACLLGGLSRLIRICGMGRGLLVDVAITSGCQRPAASAFVATDELGDREDLGRSGPGRVAWSGGNEGVVVNPSEV